MAQQKKRSYSRPVITKTLLMNSEASITALESYINKTLSELYALDVILYITADEKAAEVANDEVRKIFDKKIEHFNKEYDKYKKVMEELDLDVADYTGAQQKEFKVYCPLGSVYLRMMAKFELVTNMVDTIWLNGEMSSRLRKDRVFKMSGHMQNISAQARNIAKRAMILAKSKGKAEEVSKQIKELNIKSEAVAEVEAAEAEATKSEKKVATKATAKKETRSDLSLMDIVEKEKSEEATKTKVKPEKLA